MTAFRNAGKAVQWTCIAAATTGLIGSGGLATFLAQGLDVRGLGGRILILSFRAALVLAVVTMLVWAISRKTPANRSWANRAMLVLVAYLAIGAAAVGGSIYL